MIEVNRQRFVRIPVVCVAVLGTVVLADRIGDQIAWTAAIGPSYRAGRWGYLDLAKSMHTAMFKPAAGSPRRS